MNHRHDRADWKKKKAAAIQRLFHVTTGLLNATTLARHLRRRGHGPVAPLFRAGVDPRIVLFAFLRSGLIGLLQFRTFVLEGTHCICPVRHKASVVVLGWIERGELRLATAIHATAVHTAAASPYLLAALRQLTAAMLRVGLRTIYCEGFIV
jgi:hypothetical protein